MLKLLIPRQDGIFGIASAEFQRYWEKITRVSLPCIQEDDGESHLIILGSDAVNSFTHHQIMENTIPPLRLVTGTDDYQLLSARKKQRSFLFIAGGRPRSLLYGIYRFFEIRGGCSYFWDGDLIPRRETLRIDDLNIYERPRFQYRGLRYFAHRGLNRFQAEHWDFADWQKEIDWLLKKRLNLFMLRIGMDDLFQQAFPDIVHYPQGYKIPESIRNAARGFNNRDLFWDLEFRGALRKKILKYAQERDLLHPEDMGTMTHWYSRTPNEYLNKIKPDFLPQNTDSRYSEPTSRVWDIRQDENLDAYWKLTETHIARYGSPDLFHTIGLAERMCYADRDANQQMKLYTYRRIQSKLREKYPNAPLLIGTWDFSMHWKPQEVRNLLNELNPANTLIFDYTSDTSDSKNNFLNWGLMNRFPWIFGIFHAYEPATEIRGNYDQIEDRLPLAADDPMCKGLVYWPECSHSDPLMLAFMPEIAWQPEQCTVAEFIPHFCRQRYPENAACMTEIWRKILPLVRNIGWCGPQDMRALWVTFSDFIFKPLQDYLANLTPFILSRHLQHVRHLKNSVPDIPQIFLLLQPLPSGATSEFLRRDLIDITRTLISRLQTFGISGLVLMLEKWRTGELQPETVSDLLANIIRSAELEAEVLESHSDFSLYDSLQALGKKHPTNPDFESVLKNNAENQYCRSYAGELFRGIYLPELQVYADWIRNRISADDRSPWTCPAEFAEEDRRIVEEFNQSPLEHLAADHEKAWRLLPEKLQQLSSVSKNIITAVQTII